jgi:ribose transport system substrate-binding protein
MVASQSFVEHCHGSREGDSDVKANWVRRGAGCLSLAAVFVLMGCGGGSETTEGSSGVTAPAVAKSGEKLNLVFVSNGESDWWAAVEKGMKDGGDAFGANVRLMRNRGQATGQIKLLEDILSQPDVQGVAVSVYESNTPGIADALRELQNAGKKVITIDSDIAPEQASVRRAYVGSNNARAGEAAGKLAAVLRPAGGGVCVFVGTSSAANARERLAGFFKGAGPKFTRLEVFDDGVDEAKASNNVQNAITKYNDIGVLLGLWSYNGPHIGEQVKAAPEIRKKTNVVTFDLDERAIDLIAQGYIDVSVCQNPYDMGYKGVRLLKALITKDEATVKELLPDGSTCDTGLRLIVPSVESPLRGNNQGENVITIEEIKKWLTSKGLRST